MEKPKLVLENTIDLTWDEWLDRTEIVLNNLGYTRIEMKNYVCIYRKTFGNKYNIEILFSYMYLYKKIEPQTDEIVIRAIVIQYKCDLLEKRFYDMRVADNITLFDFEKMAESFYNTMKIYLQQ